MQGMDYSFGAGPRWECQNSDLHHGLRLHHYTCKTKCSLDGAALVRLGSYPILAVLTYHALCNGFRRAGLAIASRHR
jgi:hypothetical protein